MGRDTRVRLTDAAKSNLDVYIRECQEILNRASEPHGYSHWSLTMHDPAEIEAMLRDNLVHAAERFGRAHREMVLWLQTQESPRPAVTQSRCPRRQQKPEG